MKNVSNGTYLMIFFSRKTLCFNFETHVTDVCFRNIDQCAGGVKEHFDIGIFDVYIEYLMIFDNMILNSVNRA